MYPILFTIGGYQVPTYFVVLSLTYCVCLYWFYRRTRDLGLNVTYALDLSFIIMVAGFLGGRMLHVLYEHPEYYSVDPLRVLYIWQGGFVFYGGALLAVAGCWAFLKLRRAAFAPWADLITPPVILGYASGRIASFLSGSCYGKATSLPWAVMYPPGVEAPPAIPLHPAALYEVVWSILTLILILQIEKRKTAFFRSPSAIFNLALIFHGVGRIILECFRGDYRGELLLGMTISTWISAVLCSWGILNLYTNLSAQKN